MEVELSVVVLSYESQGYIEEFCSQLLNELEVLTINYEIILVANYDKHDDNTPALAIKLASENENITALTNLKKGKMGWDMRMGLEQAKGNYIAVIDGDGQMPSSDISLVYQVIKSGEFDLVKTYRNVRMDGWYRKTLSSWYNTLFNFLFNPSVKLKDVNAKPKIFTKKAYKDLNLQSNDWFTDAEIMIQALRKELKICEVSTIFLKNERRASFVSFKTVFEFLINLIKYRLK